MLATRNRGVRILFMASLMAPPAMGKADATPFRRAPE
jgi:hypothetical protein